MDTNTVLSIRRRQDCPAYLRHLLDENPGFRNQELAWFCFHHYDGPTSSLQSYAPSQVKYAHWLPSQFLRSVARCAAPPSDRDWHPFVTSSYGLVCYREHLPGNQAGVQLVVINPQTGHFRRLPRIPLPFTSSLSVPGVLCCLLTVDPGPPSASFTVHLILRDGTSLEERCLVFRSALGSWHPGLGTPRPNQTSPLWATIRRDLSLEYLVVLAFHRDQTWIRYYFPLPEQPLPTIIDVFFYRGACMLAFAKPDRELGNAVAGLMRLDGSSWEEKSDHRVHNLDNSVNHPQTSTLAVAGRILVLGHRDRLIICNLERFHWTTLPDLPIASRSNLVGIFTPTMIDVPPIGAPSSRPASRFTACDTTA